MTREIEAALLPGMRELLEVTGFRICSATRADCGRCPGRSRGTVGYTTEVARCFRCGWAANRISVARELGLLGTDPDTQRRLREQARQRCAIDSLVAVFEFWREARLRQVTDRYRQLRRQAALAHRILQRCPDCDSAWDALARCYHSETQVSAALDWLSFAKVSEWLEQPSTPAEVFIAWRETRAAA